MVVDCGSGMFLVIRLVNSDFSRYGCVVGSRCVYLYMLLLVFCVNM